jgi:hypothetical protein
MFKDQEILIDRNNLDRFADIVFENKCVSKSSNVDTIRMLKNTKNSFVITSKSYDKAQDQYTIKKELLDNARRTMRDEKKYKQCIGGNIITVD